ncbi:MAG: hypothetical protein FIB08_09725 [Candidatus Methanoperedens sp.]|nr:hypothetical protein [Candidatus Methanoperedens sp.]
MSCIPLASSGLRGGKLLRAKRDRYVDAFCGRVPQSVLARHYSDFSPEVLKEIYDKANLRYFN